MTHNIYTLLPWSNSHLVSTGSLLINMSSREFKKHLEDFVRNIPEHTFRGFRSNLKRLRVYTNNGNFMNFKNLVSTSNVWSALKDLMISGDYNTLLDLMKLSLEVSGTSEFWQNFENGSNFVDELTFQFEYSLPEDLDLEELDSFFDELTMSGNREQYDMASAMQIDQEEVDYFEALEDEDRVERGVHEYINARANYENNLNRISSDQIFAQTIRRFFEDFDYGDQ